MTSVANSIIKNDLDTLNLVINEETIEEYILLAKQLTKPLNALIQEALHHYLTCFYHQILNSYLRKLELHFIDQNRYVTLTFRAQIALAPRICSYCQTEIFKFQVYYHSKRTERVGNKMLSFCPSCAIYIHHNPQHPIFCKNCFSYTFNGDFCMFGNKKITFNSKGCSSYTESETKCRIV